MSHILKANKACTHLKEHLLHNAEPKTKSCQECEDVGSKPEHLLLCLTCGHVGCCDCSNSKDHAANHFRATGHPVIKPFDTGEHWRWCFVDEKYMDWFK